MNFLMDMEGIGLLGLVPDNPPFPEIAMNASQKPRLLKPETDPDQPKPKSVARTVVLPATLFGVAVLIPAAGLLLNGPGRPWLSLFLAAAFILAVGGLYAGARWLLVEDAGGVRVFGLLLGMAAFLILAYLALSGGRTANLAPPDRLAYQSLEEARAAAVRHFQHNPGVPLDEKSIFREGFTKEPGVVVVTAGKTPADFRAFAWHRNGGCLFRMNADGEVIVRPVPGLEEHED